ncbi:MAG: hypothetical protein NZM38_03585 [Cytophagales bacterium]|nr:hypothetical protein [Cytophagales bacterium]MDW8383834.1 hypothetical protein [Flammeovirgaceae bacterium]
MKLRLLIFFLFFIQQIAWGQNPFQDSILSQAERMYAYFFQQDFKSFLNYTYPKVIELSGGREKLIRQMKKEIQDYQKSNIIYKKVVFREPSHIVKAGEELHCLVPRESFFEMDGENHRLVSKMLAISQDSGKHWFFLEIDRQDKTLIKKILPHFNEDLLLHE